MTTIRGSGSPHPPLRVLVLEPAEELRERLVRLASEIEGCVVAEADSVGAAVSLLVHRTFDAVIVDVDTPGGRCLEELPGLRRWAPYTLFLAMGREESPELSDRCLELGADLYFVASRAWTRIAGVLATLTPDR